jgi:hypothetical protein
MHQPNFGNRSSRPHGLGCVVIPAFGFPCVQNPPTCLGLSPSLSLSMARSVSRRLHDASVARSSARSLMDPPRPSQTLPDPPRPSQTLPWTLLPWTMSWSFPWTLPWSFPYILFDYPLVAPPNDRVHGAHGKVHERVHGRVHGRVWEGLGGSMRDHNEGPETDAS